MWKHIEKTAGTSLAQWFRGHSDAFLVSGWSEPCTCLIRKSNNKCRHTISQHQYVLDTLAANGSVGGYRKIIIEIHSLDTDLKDAMQRATKSGCSTLNLVVFREPVAYHISKFNFYRNRRYIPQNMSLREFMKPNDQVSDFLRGVGGQ